MSQIRFPLRAYLLPFRGTSLRLEVSNSNQNSRPDSQNLMNQGSITAKRNSTSTPLPAYVLKYLHMVHQHKTNIDIEMGLGTMIHAPPLSKIVEQVSLTGFDHCLLPRIRLQWIRTQLKEIHPSFAQIQGMEHGQGSRMDILARNQHREQHKVRTKLKLEHFEATTKFEQSLSSSSPRLPRNLNKA